MLFEKEKIMYKLIFAEDERASRMGILDAIPWEELEIQVETGKNGIDALKIAETFKPDILLTDIKMPKMDGILLAQKIKELNPNCSILFISGYSEVEYLKSAIHLRAINYVDKPVIISELKEHLMKAVSEQKKLKKEIDYYTIDDVTSSSTVPIEEILKTIHEDFGNKDLSLKMLSEKYFISNVYLCKKFKEFTGKTFVRYLTELRMDMAMDLLANTDYKIVDIARKIGFEDSSYFVKTFKKEKNITPTDYRKKVNKK